MRKGSRERSRRGRKPYDFTAFLSVIPLLNISLDAAFWIYHQLQGTRMRRSARAKKLDHIVVT